MVTMSRVLLLKCEIYNIAQVLVLARNSVDLACLVQYPVSLLQNGGALIILWGYLSNYEKILKKSQSG